MRQKRNEDMAKIAISGGFVLSVFLLCLKAAGLVEIPFLVCLVPFIAGLVFSFMLFCVILVFIYKAFVKKSEKEEDLATIKNIYSQIGE